MCGRYSLGDPSPLMRRFGLTEFAETRVTPRFNVAPTELVPIVVERPEGRELRIVRWGFKPPWMKASSKRPPPINARVESLQRSPLFGSSVGRWRCLVPADGFFEWKTVPGQKKKQPVYMKLKNGEPFAFAGLYTSRLEGDDEAEGSMVIITTDPNRLVEPIHDRMPAILRPEHEATWLDPKFTDGAEVLSLLQPYPSEEMEAYEVSPAVNKAGEESPDMIKPLEKSDDESETDSSGGEIPRQGRLPLTASSTA